MHPVTPSVGRRALLACLLLFLPVLSSAAPPAATYDFGDHSSATLVGKAWAALAAKDHAAVRAYAGKCREMYLTTALEQQRALKEPVPAADRERVFAQWALNDVGTALFILGQAAEADGRSDEAVTHYKVLVDRLAFAQCWDPKGWFWRPADAAAGRIKALEYDAASR